MLSLSDCILYHVLVSLMSINIFNTTKKLGTFDKFLAFLVILSLANAIVMGTKAYYEKETKVSVIRSTHQYDGFLCYN